MNLDKNSHLNHDLLFPKHSTFGLCPQNEVQIQFLLLNLEL